MRATAVLGVRVPGPRAKRSLLSVLAPDNTGLPKGLTLSMRERTWGAEIRAEALSPSAALSTLLAVLRDAALFQEVWLLSRSDDAQFRRADPN